MNQEFEKVVKENQGMIYKICRVYSIDSSGFEELKQEILIQIWKSLPKFRGDSKLSTWLYRLCLNTALTYQSLQKKHAGHFELNGLEPAYPEYDSQKDEDVERLFAAIGQLKPVDRGIMALYLEEKTYEEIAEILGLTRVNVGVRITRAKDQLLTLLKEPNHVR